MPQVTDTELKKIALIKKEALEYASYLGELEYQKTLIQIDVDGIKSKIKALREEESKLFTELKDNYGNININLETGEFTVVQ